MSADRRWHSLEGGHSVVLFPWNGARSSLFFGCQLGLGLKEWSFNTGFCKIPGETSKCKARLRTKVGGDLIQVGGR